MDQTTHEPKPPRGFDHRGSLPTRLRLLHIASPRRASGWIREAMAADSATDVMLEEAIGANEGFTRLREARFDAVLIDHEPGTLDGLELIEGLRAGGAEEPLILLGRLPQQELAALAFEVGADAYCVVQTTTPRMLLWTLARAIERHSLIRENRRLVQAERQRLRSEHREAQRLLGQQRAIIADLENLCREHAPDADPADPGLPGYHLPPHLRPPADITGSTEQETFEPTAELQLPEKLVSHYRDLLKAYVIMGTGNLADEMASLAELLVRDQATARQTMQLHLQVVEEMVQGLGNRSARHVLSRADLLILEVMAQLAEGYRAEQSDRSHCLTVAGHTA